MAVKNKADLISGLTRSASKIKAIRENAALIKASINTIEPAPLPTLGETLVPGSTIQANNQRTN